jgi:uncharacterized surface protein with fasciclin (FAS1) repeats
MTRIKLIITMKRTTYFGMAGFLSLALLSACGGKGGEDPAAVKARQDSIAAAEQVRQDSIAAANALGSIAEIASEDERFSTLVDLLGTAGLVETLADEASSFTVFAPTNEAFAALGERRLAQLSELSRRQELTDVLTYHVVSGVLRAADLGNYTELDALDEKVIRITRKDGRSFVANAGITQTDIEASNGVIHVIDAVMTPPKEKSRAVPPATTSAQPTDGIKADPNVKVNTESSTGTSTRGTQTTTDPTTSKMQGGSTSGDRQTQRTTDKMSGGSTSGGDQQQRTSEKMGGN